MSTFTSEIGDALCARIADGESLRSICRDADMPCKAVVFKWLRLHPEFERQYSIAIEARSDALVEEILDIADDGSNDWMEVNDKANAGWKANGEHINRSRLRVDTRKWIAGKMKPKRYGDKLDLSGAVTLNHASQLTDDQLAIIAAGGSGRTAQPETGA